MDVRVHSIHFNADEKLEDFIQRKLRKLDLLHANVTAANVYLRVDHSDVKENKLAEIKVLIPGKEIFARKKCKTFEEAIDTSIEALRRQIVKHKGKLKAVS